jgi:bifunctional non-homologous end joining protein LigD
LACAVFDPPDVALLSAYPPTGDAWVHEAKLDGWRCLVVVSGGPVEVWSRRGGDYTSKLPELQSLSCLGDVVLDGELVVITDGGRADFELLSSRVIGRKARPAARHPVRLLRAPPPRTRPVR